MQKQDSDPVTAPEAPLQDEEEEAQSPAAQSEVDNVKPEEKPVPQQTEDPVHSSANLLEEAKASPPQDDGTSLISKFLVAA